MHRTRAHSIASRADKPKPAPAPTPKPTLAPTPTHASIDPRVAALEKELAEMKAKSVSEVSTAPPLTTLAPPTGLHNSFAPHAYFLPFTAAGNPLTWSVADVGKWMLSINMDNYADSFAKHKIDGQCLKHMDDESLRVIGVSLPVHRTKLLQQVLEVFGSGFCFLLCLRFDH